jgi:hypothetical protein
MIRSVHKRFFVNVVKEKYLSPAPWSRRALGVVYELLGGILSHVDRLSRGIFGRDNGLLGGDLDLADCHLRDLLYLAHRLVGPPLIAKFVVVGQRPDSFLDSPFDHVGSASHLNDSFFRVC